MASQTKGFCKYCGKEYTRAGITRHLSSCKERTRLLEQEPSKRRCGYFQLFISGWYNSDYWIAAEIKDTATLEDLDDFLRDIWLECCGHLSSFTIDGRQYDSAPDADFFCDEPSEDMDIKLKKILAPGMTIRYEYDFGSTTELAIKVQSHRTGAFVPEAVTILSRNQPPEILCSQCGTNPAQWVMSDGMFDEKPFWCEECLQAGREEEGQDDSVYEYMLPVCNSPRMGVCAYEGSVSYPEIFEPDKKVR